MTNIHPSAIVDPRAQLGEGVRVGPMCIIQGSVTLGEGTQVHAHTIIGGTTRIGRRCQIGPGAYVGLDPQHHNYDGRETCLHIGDDTVIREGASIHRGMAEGPEQGTHVGSHCFMMACAHVGHDCRVADHVTLANAVLLGGYVEVGGGAFIGGGTVVHQFVRIGRLVIVAGGEAISKDIPPFAAVRYGGMKAYNAIGCRRAGIDRKHLRAIRAAYRQIHAHRSFADAMSAVDPAEMEIPVVRELFEFGQQTRRGIISSVHTMPASQRSNLSMADGSDE